jgi:hypothetical protein
MKKLLFAFLLMTPFCLSFCKKKTCKEEEKREKMNQSINYIETDTLGGFKGQNTLVFFNECSCSANGLDCINDTKAGCFSTGFKVFNLTNKKATIRIFATENEAQLNQFPKEEWTLLPKSTYGLYDAGLEFFKNPCSSDLQKLVRVTYQ